MSENESPGENYGTWSGKPRLESRRSFLRTAWEGAQALTGVWLGKKLDLPLQQTQAAETELPSDILSDEELESRFRTRIHDLPKENFPTNYVELHLRRSVENEPLFQRLESGRVIGLDIFLIDSDQVDPSHFTQEQRQFLADNPTIEAGVLRAIEKAKETNRQEIEENKESMRGEYQERLNNLNQRRTTMNNDRYQVEFSALEYQYDRYLSNEPTEHELKEIAIRGRTETQLTGENDRGETGSRSFIFMATRDRQESVTFTSGNEILTISAQKIPYRSQANSDSYAPNPEQSYPESSEFAQAEGGTVEDYLVVGGLTPGFILRHELGHAQGRIVEGDADLVALNGITRAADHMRETGSDSEYWAVFETPEGITITENQAGAVA